MSTRPAPQLEKLETGIAGFDHIAYGGMPKGRTTLISGTAGSAKTVFANQFLAEGVLRGENGVFVTFEESPEDIRKNMLGFGWDIPAWEAEGKWAFVDASPRGHDLQYVISGDYDLGALIARIEHAVKRVGATRLAMDSLGAIFVQFSNQAVVRGELLHIAKALKEMDVTSIMTAERTDEYGQIARFGVEEFVADNVIILRNVLESEKRRRTIEVLKFRGTMHQKGEFPFTIMPGGGIVAIPISAIELKQQSTDIRISSGIGTLDDMCGGGFFRDSIILVSGATGTGKTLITTHFISGAKKGERSLLFAFEESREQLFRNAKGWGVDFQGLEDKGLLKVVCAYPEAAGLEDHLITMKQAIQEFKPHRVAVDSLSALERVSTMKGFREFVMGLTSFIKHHEMAGLFTSTTPTLLGGTSVTEAHISTITDTIILLRYVEMYGEMRRGLTVLKMRGSRHDKDIREFSIDEGGMHVGKAFRNVTGILTGTPTYSQEEESDRIQGMFRD